MKKNKMKRIFIEVLQHCLAACIMIAVAGLLLNSYIKVDSVDGTRTYKLTPFENEGDFEDSDVYRDLFRSVVEDITEYAKIKSEVEEKGEFHSTKAINITRFATGTETDDNTITAIYELDDLIKWGKFGITYQDNLLDLSSFVNYFGYCIYPENFKLDEYGQLCFDGFYRMGKDAPATGELIAEDEFKTEEIGQDTENDETSELSNIPTNTVYYGKSIQEIEEIEKEIVDSKYKQNQLEDLVFAYIISMCGNDIEASYDNDKLVITVPMIVERYSPTDNKSRMTDKVNNWVDYMTLQNNLVKSINKMSSDYQKYLAYSTTYAEGNTNAKYVIRLMTEEGMQTYTNISELTKLPDEEITENFAEYERYLIYYPDSLEFMGNTFLTEEEIYSMVNNNRYDYPDSFHFWIGIDTSYSVTGDTFSDASELYNKIVPNAGRIITIIAGLAILWLLVGILLTYKLVKNDDRLNINRFDRMHSEIFIAIAAALFYGGYRWFLALMQMTERADAVSIKNIEIQLTGLLQYGLYACFGLYFSIVFSIIWYSLVRRFHAGILWERSFLNKIYKLLGKVSYFLMRHRNSMASILLPFNLYIFTNLLGIIMAIRMRDAGSKWQYIVLAGIILFNGIVGVVLVRSSAEKNEIIKGINRIRGGEVDYKLDVEGFHGEWRDLADSVNNIGDGIGKAVKTSMKDEQMKTDLITNVSHDIKTPLTSIINYVDLLKRLKITEEPAKGYIDILDNKAKRLKQLTDDLVEASKISSGNIELECTKLNLTELLNQGIGEFSEKFEENNLEVIFETCDVPGYIYADSRRMWRIVENLLNNICKYALSGTRVYVDMKVEDGKVFANIKNISKQQMNISPDELTERFIRGDSARSTEGSGLGLSIAKNLTIVQGGEFDIYLDGDLFKVTLTFPEYTTAIE